MNKWYVYLLLREDNTPYYVGKGKCGRCYQRGGRDLPLTEQGEVDKDRIQIVFESENEDLCYQKEVEYISLYGRECDGGILQNKYLGGGKKSKVTNFIERKKETTKEWKEKNKESIREYNREYKQKNKERDREENRRRSREYMRRKRQKLKEKLQN